MAGCVHGSEVVMEIDPPDSQCQSSLSLNMLRGDLRDEGEATMLERVRNPFVEPCLSEAVTNVGCIVSRATLHFRHYDDEVNQIKLTVKMSAK